MDTHITTTLYESDPGATPERDRPPADNRSTTSRLLPGLVAAAALLGFATPALAAPGAAASARKDDKVAASAHFVAAAQASSLARPVSAATSVGCQWVVKPYGQKINGSWYVVGGGGTCASAMYTVTLQQKRWWGWDDRDDKTILFSKGSGYPKAKCRDFGWYTWRTVAQRWWQDANHHWIHLGGPIISSSWRTRC